MYLHAPKSTVCKLSTGVDLYVKTIKTIISLEIYLKRSVFNSNHGFSVSFIPNCFLAATRAVAVVLDFISSI